MNENPLISVIVPIYKVEKYLRTCIESIINQTHKNLEIILINDFSPDDSSKICEEYAKKDKRIKVIEHTQNKGIGAARNSGLNIASGEYIGFVDSDDWIEADMYECLLQKITNSEKQIVMCQMFIEYENRSEYKDYGLNDEEMDFNVNVNVNDPLIQVVWNKLYLRELFSDIKFMENGISEDAAIFYFLIKKANGSVLLKKPLYHYVIRENSQITSKFTPNKYHYFVGFFDYILEVPFMKPYENRLRTNYVNSVWSLLGYMKGNYYKENDVWTKKMIKIIRDNKNYIHNSSILHNIMLKSIAFGFNYKIVLFIRNCLRIFKEVSR